MCVRVCVCLFVCVCTPEYFRVYKALHKERRQQWWFACMYVERERERERETGALTRNGADERSRITGPSR